jgi:hypothetical protein
MTIEEFWSTIEKSRQGWDEKRRDGNMDRQLQDLKELLCQLSPEEVASFERHLEELFHRAYRWDLWHAAFLVEQGCSDDGFMDFRGWLISMGRFDYERALADVESLAEIAAAPGVESAFCEEFMSVPSEVYEKQTHQELDVKVPHPAEPAGRRVPDAEFPTRFPKLWRKFGGR